ncbi:hypothetical protein [Amycolatopsis sp. NPDC004625]|uniref:Mu transposase domain-containing protein n=1 Tax=Amycolatopsis sp. NPDC004625 TaxID=3154670 RepID=UPI0033BB9253
MSVFAEREAEALAPLPRRLIELATWSRGTIGFDIHLKVGKTLYSMPWRRMGREVDARATAATVQIRQRRADRYTPASDGLQTHRARALPAGEGRVSAAEPDWCRTQAAELGEHVAAVVEDLLQVNAIFRLRAAQKIIALADTYDPVRLDRACGMAIATDAAHPGLGQPGRGSSDSEVSARSSMPRSSRLCASSSSPECCRP